MLRMVWKMWEIGKLGTFFPQSRKASWFPLIDIIRYSRENFFFGISGWKVSCILPLRASGRRRAVHWPFTPDIMRRQCVLSFDTDDVMSDWQMTYMCHCSIGFMYNWTSKSYNLSEDESVVCQLRRKEHVKIWLSPTEVRLPEKIVLFG